jgi:hypothetical protein
MSTGAQTPAAVPMQIAALWSDGTTGLAPPSEDFTALAQCIPASGNFSDALPWLGESADIPANESIALPAGLHIHWTLPQALRRGTTVYVVSYAVANELVQQGVPCSLVAALSAAAGLDREYGHQDFVALLNGLAGSTAPLGPDAFVLASSATPYPGLISSDADIVVETVAPALRWDRILVEVYGPTILHTAAQMKLPPVPDRWLVVRSETVGGAATAWVVESDRLTAADIDGSAPAGAGPRGIPGRFSKAQIDEWGDVAVAETIDYLGLKTAAATWTEAPAAPRLAPLTAVGHGAVDFAAFYPNYQGVFGFHDPDADATGQYLYSIIGWFSDPTSDPLSSAYTVEPWATKQTTDETRAQALGWTIEGGDWSAVDGTVCTAAIAVAPSACPAQPEAEIPQEEVTVAIGNTAGEALAAFLARDATGNAAGLPPQSALNAAQAGVLADVLGADGPAVIENAIHLQGFQPVAAGSTWQVAATPPATAGLSGSPQDGQIVLSPAMCAALSTLNEAQIAFDRSLDVQQAQRQLLFGDWCRSLHLETDASGASLSPVFPNGATESNAGVALSNAAGTVLTASAAAVRAASVDGSAPPMAPFAAASALYLAHAAAQAALAALPTAAGLYLRRQPAPRYWRPNDPVVLLAETAGGDLTASPLQPLPRQSVNGADYLLLSLFAPAAAPAWLPGNWDAIAGVPQATAIGGALSGIPAVTAAVSWRPLSLQWAAAYFPYRGAGTITAATQESGPFTVTDYDGDFIAENFTPDATGIDLLPRSQVAPDPAQASRYLGRAILSGHAQQTMRERILQLAGQLSDPPATSAGLKLPGILAADPLKSLLGNAYDSGISTLAQTLNGFNDELLMLRRISQVSKFAANYKFAAWQSGEATPSPPWDEASQSFFDEIGIQGRSSPDQASGYNPIRAGECQLTELVLVDAFGQRRRWQAAAQSLNTVIANTLPNLTGTASGSAPSFFLPPRYAQPGRLLFRWLAAGMTEEVESSQDPYSTPVCGWVALNRVDQTILLFLEDGTLVGWIATETGEITYLPGRSAADITDPWFNQLIAQVATAAVAPLFFDDVNQALLTIEPRSHRHHVSRSVLESRPIAIARAELRLQLKGVPQPHQGYEALAAMATTATGPSPYLARETCEFESVSVPVRLGDVSMEDDGLVAYWPIAAGAMASTYTLVDTDPESGPAGGPTVPLAPADAAPLQLLLLLDPRASVHATSGMLPVMGVSIPNEMFSDALGRMEYLMRVSPLVTPSGQVAMPLPAEAAGPWSWLVDEGTQWSDPVTPAKTDSKIHPAPQPAVLRAGYLKTQ